LFQKNTTQGFKANPSYNKTFVAAGVQENVNIKPKVQRYILP